MPTCPDGHESASADFCDTCGMRIEGAAAASATAASGASAAPGATAASGTTAAPGATASGESCPQCGTAKTGTFCEACGFDYASGTPNANAAVSPPAAPDPAASIPQPYVGTASTTNVVAGGTSAAATAATAAPAAAAAAAPATGSTWTAVVTADRDYFNSVIASGGPDAASIEFPTYCPERRFTLGGQEMRIGRRSASRGLEPEIDLTGPPTDPGVSHLHAVLIAQPDGTWSVLDPGSANGTQVNGTDVVTGVPVPLSAGDRVSVGAWTVLTIQSA